jgi:hypothetical protein
VLHVMPAGNDAETYDVVALDGPFAALAPMSFLDDGDNGYDADAPDVLAAGAGATAVLAYAGEAGTAAIAWDSGIVLGFPLEVVQGEEARRDLIGAAMVYFGVEPEPEPEPPTAAGCCSAGGSPAGAVLFAIVLGLRRRRTIRRS